MMFVPGNLALVKCTPDATFCPNVGPPKTTYYYLFKYHPRGTADSRPIPEMTGSDLNLKGTRQDFGTQGTDNGQPLVLMQFTHGGAKKFQDVTRTLAERGRTRSQTAGSPSGQEDNYAQQFAIVLDREIKSAPTISFRDNPNGIPGTNGAEITGIGSVQEAKDLALVLQTGALPYNFRQLEKTEVSATLGKDSLAQAKLAAIAGLIVVALFLLIFYRFLGLVAVIGLGIYAVLLYAALLIFNVTLTLPGFAGLILTIGVAADANVVVFERIKEEVRAGKSVRAAISTGYAKGFHTIIDANVVTAITALVLFLVATAGVKGFALMLLIGTAISLVTAVFATRAMLGLLAGFRWFENPAFMGAKGQQHGRWLQIDFMGKRRLWFAISGCVVAIAIISLGVRGLNLGIDFKGGSQVTFQTPQPQLVDDVRSDAQSIDSSLSKAVIQGRGASTGRQVQELPAADQGAQPGGRGEAAHRAGVEARRDALRVDDRLRELRAADREVGAVGDLRLAAPDRPLPGDPLRLQVRDPGARGADPRHRDHGRRVLAHGAGGDDRDRGGGVNGARVLDLRHDHHLRPHPGERPADAARLVRDDRQHLALGDDQALPGHDVHHVAAGDVAAHLRRRDPEGLRVRAADRDRVRCVLVDLHRRSAADDPQGARAGVGGEEGARYGGRRRHAMQAVLAQAEVAAAEEPRARSGARARDRRRGWERRALVGTVEAGAAAAASSRQAAWPTITAASSRRRSSGSGWPRSVRSR